MVDSLLRKARIPGCAIVVVDAERVRWSHAYGMADVAARRPARVDTVWHLFSGTKVYTATAVLQLVERGALSLDDPVAAHLPEWAAAEGVTLGHLLSHASGIRDTVKAFLGIHFPEDPVPTTADALAAYKVRPGRVPGQAARYSNVNYALLGEVVSRVAGVPYVDYVKRHILEPLSMAADFTLTEGLRPHAATGYMRRFHPMRPVLALMFPDVGPRIVRGKVGGLVALGDYDLDTAAIGGIMGSVTDLSRFVQAHLRDEVPGLPPGAVRAMREVVAPGAAGVASREGVGLGWKIGAVGTRRFVNHEGGGPGFTTETRIYPDLGLGIVLAMNIFTGTGPMKLAHTICERLVLAPPWEGRLG